MSTAFPHGTRVILPQNPNRVFHVIGPGLADGQLIVDAAGMLTPHRAQVADLKLAPIDQVNWRDMQPGDVMTHNRRENSQRAVGEAGETMTLVKPATVVVFQLWERPGEVAITNHPDKLKRCWHGEDWLVTRPSLAQTAGETALAECQIQAFGRTSRTIPDGTGVGKAESGVLRDEVITGSKQISVMRRIREELQAAAQKSGLELLKSLPSGPFRCTVMKMDEAGHAYPQTLVVRQHGPQLRYGYLPSPPPAGAEPPTWSEFARTEKETLERRIAEGSVTVEAGPTSVFEQPAVEPAATTM